VLELRHDDRDLLNTTLLTWPEVGCSASAAGAARCSATPTRCATGYAGSRKPRAVRSVCRRISLSLSPRCGRGQNYRTKTDVVSLTLQPPNAWPGKANGSGAGKGVRDRSPRWTEGAKT
jgi:hypothetical protein